MPWILSQVLAASLGLIVEGRTTCPTPLEVADAIRPLLREEIAGSDDRLRLSVRNGRLRVDLLDARGDLLAGRELPADEGCRAQAHRVAVMAAAWQAQLSDEPLPPAPEIPQQEPVAETEATQRAARLWPATAPPSHPTPAYLEIGYRLTFAPNGGITSAFALGAGATWRRFGIQGGVWAELSRTYQLGDAQEGHFFRAALELGPTAVLRADSPGIQVRLQAVAAGLFADGQASFDPGVQAGFRLLAGGGPARAFIDLTGTLWPRFLPAGSAPALSPLEVFATVGLMLGGA